MSSLNTELHPCNPRESLDQATQRLQQAVGNTQHKLASLWEDLRTQFIAANIQEPFADYVQNSFSRIEVLTILRAVFATEWSAITAKGSKEASRQNSARQRLGLEENLELFLWFGSAVCSQRCWKILSQHNLGPCNARDLFLELRRAHTNLAPTNHYLVQSFKPKHFNAAVLAIQEKQRNISAQDRLSSDEPTLEKPSGNQPSFEKAPTVRPLIGELPPEDQSFDDPPRDEFSFHEPAGDESSSHQPVDDDSSSHEPAPGEATSEMQSPDNVGPSEDSGVFLSDDLDSEKGGDRATTEENHTTEPNAVAAKQKTGKADLETEIQARMDQVWNTLLGNENAFLETHCGMDTARDKWRGEQDWLEGEMQKTRDHMSSVLDSVSTDPGGAEDPVRGSLIIHYDEYRKTAVKKRKATEEITAIESKRQAIRSSMDDLYDDIMQSIRRHQERTKDIMRGVHDPEPRDATLKGLV